MRKLYRPKACMTSVDVARRRLQRGEISGHGFSSVVAHGSVISSAISNFLPVLFCITLTAIAASGRWKFRSFVGGCCLLVHTTCAEIACCESTLVLAAAAFLGGLCCLHGAVLRYLSSAYLWGHSVRASRRCDLLCARLVWWTATLNMKRRVCSNLSRGASIHRCCQSQVA